MEVVYTITLFLHFLNCFFLVFAIFLSSLARFGFMFRIFLWSLSSFSLVKNTLLGWMPTWTVFPLAFSWCTPASVDDVFLPVDLNYFVSLLPFVVSLHDLNFIIHSDGHGLNMVLQFQLFGMWKSTEKPFIVLALVRSHTVIELHFGLLCFYDGAKGKSFAS